MGELYLHTHSRRQDGKSPVVAQIASSVIPGGVETNENTDVNGLQDPSTEEPTTLVPDYDIHSLHFTNSEARKLYVSCIIYINVHLL